MKGTTQGRGKEQAGDRCSVLPKFSEKSGLELLFTFCAELSSSFFLPLPLNKRKLKLYSWRGLDFYFKIKVSAICGNSCKGQSIQAVPSSDQTLDLYSYWHYQKIPIYYICHFFFWSTLIKWLHCEFCHIPEKLMFCLEDSLCTEPACWRGNQIARIVDLFFFSTSSSNPPLSYIQ